MESEATLIRPVPRTAVWADYHECEPIAVERICHWWRQPDHFDWLSSYLAARNLQRFTRFMMATIVLLLAAAPLLMLNSPVGPQGTVTRVLSIVVAAVFAIMAVSWATAWPSRTQSLAFVLLANAGVAAMCLAQSTPTAGLHATMAFAAVAGYVAFFHTSRALLLTLSVASVTASICAAQLIADGDPWGALSKLLVLSVGVLAVPFSAQVLTHFLGVDALRSDTDPLTELPNRRGFYRSMRTLAIEAVDSRSLALSTLMIDLDAFKRVNDTAGHAAGDQTLIEVADILRRTRRGDSVIARIGGEEFVVGVVGDRESAIGLAERLCREISETPWRVTASVGVASVTLSRIPAEGLRAFLQGLVEASDRAMYTAKRAGGNQVYVAGTPHPTEPPPPMVAPTFDYAAAPSVDPMPRRTTATNGSVPWMAADRNLSRADRTRTTAAADMDPAPAKTRAAPAAVPPEIISPTPTAVTTAKKRL
ncbi:hypothetical protein GCM10023114_02470 [Mycolicibacterium sediminis]|uniref:GGDEF domain-containing protein n=1 Tax=Mycolicibacterium sediminis TaxID=1286180 RepID=A0A7I7QUB9_9MYCO|nr:hypothetical protein MSEDJ_36730 [Mycolicibacterium sediminis]